MNILDFHKSNVNAFDYDTVQEVWGGEVDISVVFDIAEREDEPKSEEKNLRGIVRLLREKLNFVEGNREIIEKMLVESDIADITENDLESLYISWILFTVFVDTGEYELFLYFGFESDIIDDVEIAVTVHNDNTITIDDIV